MTAKRERAIGLTFAGDIRVIHCPICGSARERRKKLAGGCATCGGQRFVAVTSQSLLVGLRLVWDPDR